MINFKKMTVSLLMSIAIVLTSSSLNSVSAASLDLEAESAILVDAETGEILFAKEADIKLPPASMTKMMTEYLVLEAIDNGEFDWDTTIQIDDYPYAISANPAFSGIGLRQSQDYTVRQLYEGMAIISDNATTIALAELVAGSETEFVEMMNDKGEELGLTDYEFVNSTGLNNASLDGEHPEGTAEDADNLMSARATAILAYHLVNDYPEVLEFSSMLTSELDGEHLENLNWMLPWDNTNFAQYYFEGVDGLKTGFTTEAGYSFTSTAEQDGQRLITVVMRTDSYGARFEQTQELLDYGFSEFEKQTLFEAGDQLEDESVIDVDKGREDTVEVELADDLSAMVKDGEEDLYSIEYEFDTDYLNDDEELVAPIEQGDVVGQVRLVYGGEDHYGNIYEDQSDQRVDLIATSDVEQANWFMLSMGAIGDFFSDLFSTVVDSVTGWF